MLWPVYFKEQLSIGNPESAVGVCSLWTLKETIAEKLPQKAFSICGQLYSKEGIKYILKNILANPRISFLILCGQDKSQSGLALIETFQQKDSPDKTVPEEAFSDFRQNVKIIDLRGEANAQNILKVIDNLKPATKPWAEPRIFKEEKISVQSFPCDPAVFKIKGATVAEAWPWILKYLVRFGNEKQTDYGMKEKELINLAAVITLENPDDPKIADYFDFTKEEFVKYARQIITAESMAGLEYTYGERLRDYQGIDQIKQGIVERLKNGLHSRRAIACTWKVEKDIASKQPPCLILTQALIQNNLLYLTCYFRSNDMFKAWPQNAMALRKLQGLIARELNIGLGSLTTISASAHIYENDFAKAEQIAEKYADNWQCQWDENGNFVISIDVTAHWT